MDFSGIKVGDKLIRAMEGFKTIGDPVWRDAAEVTEVDQDTITCLVKVDHPLAMKFDRKTGVSVCGENYGWLEAAESEAE